MLVLILVFVGSVVIASISEGLLHQFILHTGHKRFLWGALYGAFRAHAIEHHPAYREENYHRPAPDEEQAISLGWYTLPLVLIIFSPVAWLLYVHVSLAAAIIFFSVLISYYVSYEFLHWHMHFPSKDGSPRWYARYQPLKTVFDWFDKRHYVHHLADDRNFNVVLPVYDLAFGSYTTDIALVPWRIRLRTRRNKRRAGQIREALNKKI